MSGSPQLPHMVFCELPQAVRYLVGRPLPSFGIKKPLPGRGLFEIEVMSECVDDSKPHHFGHCAQIRIQIGVEGSIVVVDGAIGVLQSVAGEDADHCGPCRDFVSAFEQASH